MSEADEGRNHEPTQKRLEDARAKGDVARSADLTAAVAMAGFIGAWFLAGASAITTFGNRAEALLGQVDRMAGGRVLAGSGALAGWVAALVAPVVPLMALPAMAALLALLGQRGLVFSAEKLGFRLSRIDPLANARQKFGPQGLVDFLKSAAKLAVTGILLGGYLWHRLPDLLSLGRYEAGPAAAGILKALGGFLMLAFAVGLVFGLLDFGWQHFSHLRRNRMTRQEVIDELRQSEGDPHMKGARRRRAEQIATNRMVADVARADVVIVNPTHFAVALRWDKARGRAPLCLAKGTDALAARIREAAQKAGVPVRRDPPAARALYATVEVGAEIRPEHYAPVAAAIRFAERMRRRAREQNWRS
jgi:flagellar biosynthetic protein FlhB